MFLSPITRLVRRTERLAAVAVTLAAGSPSAHASQAVQEIARKTPTADQVIIAPVSRFAKNMKAARDSGQYSTDLLNLVEKSQKEAAAETLATGVIVHKACAASGKACKTVTEEACKAEAAAVKTKAVKSEPPKKCVEQTLCEIQTELECNQVWNKYKEEELNKILNGD